MKNNKKQLLALAMLLSCIGVGLLNIIPIHAMEEAISPAQIQMMSKDEVLRELAGKVKKLEGYDDMYVGAGYSAAGEPMFFGMEKLDVERAKVWRAYADILYRTPGMLGQLKGLNHYCQDQGLRKELTEKGDFYRIGLMDIMCPNKQRLSTILGNDGTSAGINGFNSMLTRQKGGDSIYAAYASTEPITGPFKPKKETGRFPTPEEFESAYPDIIISIGVDMERGISRTEHRGIFKNPFFDVKGTYRNIGLKLHGWASTVEKQIFNKAYMIVWPTDPAAELLHRTVKAGDMYIGVDNLPYPYDDEALKEKFPSINKELIGMDPYSNTSPFVEALHIFELNKLSKYYTE
jgi:hypothetical protein